MRGLIARKTLSSLGTTALVTWRTHVTPEALAAGTMAFYGGSSQEAPQYRYENGSVINIGGMDKATRIMSSEYDLVYVQEAIELVEEDWEAITTRLRNGVLPYQQLLADTNPAEPTHWLKARCDRGACRLYDSRHEENPVLFGEDGRVTEAGAAYMAKLDALTGVRYLRLRKGLWVAAEGVIYEDWSPAVHLVDPRPIPDDWPRFWAVDFGYVNPFVCQMWAEDPDGQLILYREIYRTKRLVEDHARDIMACVSVPDPHHTPRPGDVVASGRTWTEPKPRAIVCDHDAEGRATLARQLNLPTKAADKAVLDGIQRFQARLRPRADGRPGLVIMRDALVYRDPELVDAKKPTCTAEEIPGYVWLIRPSTGTTTQKTGKEEPLKENDHGCDTGRYLVMYRDPMSRPGMRTL